MRFFCTLLLAVCLAGCNGSSGEPAPPAQGGSGGGSGGGGGSPAPPTTGPFVAAVYTADNELDGVRRLFAINTAGRILDLSYTLGDAVHVDEFALSPDQQQVAFGAEDGVDPGLFVSPVNADTPTPIGPRGVVVEEIDWNPDGSVIAYRASASPAQLYLVAPDGTGLVNVTGGVAEVVTGVAWSPDGQWLAFHWNRDTVDHYDLFVVRADGTGLRKIAGSVSAAVASRFYFAWSPTANCLAFRADLDTPDTFDVYVVDVDGGAPVRVSTEAGTTGNVGSFDFTWAPDGTALLYRRKDAATDDFALFLVSKGGGDAKRISGGADSVRFWEWSHDSALVAFKDGDAIYTTDGATPPVEHGRHTFIGDFEWSPSDATLVYEADSALNRNLYVIDVAAQTTTLAAEDVDGFAFEAPSRLAADLPRSAEEVLLIMFFGSVERGVAALEAIEDGERKTRAVLPRDTARCTTFTDPEGNARCMAERDMGDRNYIASIPTTGNPATDALLGANVVAAFLNAQVGGDWPCAGYGQAYDCVLDRPGLSLPVEWYIIVNGQRKIIDVFEFNPLFNAQIPPNRYTGSFKECFLDPPSPATLILNEIGFPSVVDLHLEPVIIPGEAFSILFDISGSLNYFDGSPALDILASPNPAIASVVGAISGEPLWTDPQGGGTILEIEEGYRVIVLGIHTSAERYKVVWYPDGGGSSIIGWMDVDDVDIDVSVPVPIIER